MFSISLKQDLHKVQYYINSLWLWKSLLFLLI